jgi:3-oxoadipate enol-lactonase
VATVDLGAVTLYFERVDGRRGAGRSAGKGVGTTEEAGDRLLFISGTGGDLRNPPSVFEGPLGSSFDLLAYDQRGLGQSSVPEGPYTMADYADDAAGLLEHVGWDSCLVMGASFGGMVAQELAIRHPDVVTRLVLACTSAGGAGGASYPLQELELLRGKERIERQLELMDTRWTPGRRLTQLRKWKMMVDGFGAYLARSTPSPEQRRGAALQLEARSHHDTWDRLAAITCPTLVCGGRFDGIAPPANSERLAERIPGATLALFGGGHQFLWQDRSAYPRILAFLNGRDGEGPR